MEWTVQEEIHGLKYNISIFPQADIQYTGMKNASLTLSYNVQYNISIVALCGENSSPPLYIEFSYGMTNTLVQQIFDVNYSHQQAMTVYS